MSRSTIRWRAATPLVDMVERMPLNRVALTVVRERSAAFYGDHFGLTQRIHDDEHLLILGSGDGSELVLSEGDPVAPQLPRTNHFGLRLENDQAVRAVRERLRDAGITETEWQDDGRRFVRGQVADPDGYRVGCTPTDPRPALGSRAARWRICHRTVRRVDGIRQSDIVDVTMIRGPGGDPAGGGDRAPISH